MKHQWGQLSKRNFVDIQGRTDETSYKWEDSSKIDEDWKSGVEQASPVQDEAMKELDVVGPPEVLESNHLGTWVRVVIECG